MEKVNKVKKNAEAYRNLLNIEYYFCLGYKGKGFEVRIHFSKEEFHHLEGIGQLRDLKIHSESGNITFDMSLAGKILEDEMAKSSFYQSGHVQNKVDYIGESIHGSISAQFSDGIGLSLCENNQNE